MRKLNLLLSIPVRALFTIGNLALSHLEALTPKLILAEQGSGGIKFRAGRELAGLKCQNPALSYDINMCQNVMEQY